MKATKFEIASSTRYEDRKGDAKYGKWSGLRYLGVTQGHSK